MSSNIHLVPLTIPSLSMKNIAASSSSDRVIATAKSHAGEVFQGAVRDGIKTSRVLLSLPAPTLWTKAELSPTPGVPLSIEPGCMSKAQRAAVELLKTIHEPVPNVRIRLTTNIPTGKGCGSSTADVLATIRALLRYFKLPMTEERVARLVVAAEEAADGSVLSQATVFRHREGLVHEYLDAAFPAMQVMVVDTEPARTISTVSMLRARYSETELKQFEELLGRAKHAFRTHDAAELGRIATESACISQRYLPKPHLEALIVLTREAGGYGVAVSHSGTVASLMLPPGLTRRNQQWIRRSVETLEMACITDYFLGVKPAKEAAA